MANQPPSMLKAAAIGGSAAGLAAAIPVVNWINCACCALVIGGGFLAAFLYSKEAATSGTTFGPGNGAMVGLTAAPFYAVVAALLGTALMLVTGNDIGQAMEQMQQFGTEMPPEAEEWMERMASAGPGLLFGISLGVSLLVGAIFSTVGGLIGGSVFKNEPAPPAPPVSSAPPMPPVPPQVPPQVPPVGGTPPTPGT